MYKGINLALVLGKVEKEELLFQSFYSTTVNILKAESQEAYFTSVY